MKSSNWASSSAPSPRNIEWLTKLYHVERDQVTQVTIYFDGLDQCAWKAVTQLTGTTWYVTDKLT